MRSCSPVCVLSSFFDKVSIPTGARRPCDQVCFGNEITPPPQYKSSLVFRGVLSFVFSLHDSSILLGLSVDPHSPQRPLRAARPSRRAWPQALRRRRLRWPARRGKYSHHSSSQCVPAQHHSICVTKQIQMCLCTYVPSTLYIALRTTHTQPQHLQYIYK